MERLGTSYFYHEDGLGSIMELTNDIGSVVQSYLYDSYGNINAFDGSGGPISVSTGIANPYTYTGREFDDETGLYFYRARYYDATTAIFITEDPIGLIGGDTNLYSYVANSPVYAADPFGLLVVPAPVAVGLSNPITAGVVIVAVGGALIWYTYDQAQQKDKEYQDYKKTCEEKLRKTGDKCLDLRNEMIRSLSCIIKRKDWDAKWNPGRHAQSIREEKNRYRKFRKDFENCKKHKNRQNNQ